MEPMVKCRYRFDMEAGVFCRKKNAFVEHSYHCSKTHCEDCSFPVLAIIHIPVGRCDECPFHYTDYTRGAGCADDYFCKAANGRKITGYVEWDDEIPPVPTWCPFYLRKGEEDATLG